MRDAGRGPGPLPVVVFGVRVAQWANAAGEVGHHERVAAVPAQVVRHERGQPGEVFAAARVALSPQLLDRIVHAESVPQHDAVQDQAQGAELFLHADVVALVVLALVAMEDSPAQVVAALGQVGLALDVAPVGLVVDLGQDVQALEDAPVAGDGLAERGGVPVALHNPDHLVGAAGGPGG